MFPLGGTILIFYRTFQEEDATVRFFQSRIANTGKIQITKKPAQ